MMALEKLSTMTPSHRPVLCEVIGLLLHAVKKNTNPKIEVSERYFLNFFISLLPQHNQNQASLLILKHAPYSS